MLHCTVQKCACLTSSSQAASSFSPVRYRHVPALAGSRTRYLIINSFVHSPNQGCKDKPLPERGRKKKYLYFRAADSLHGSTARASVACHRPYKLVVAQAGGIHVSFLLLASGPRPSYHVALLPLLYRRPAETKRSPASSIRYAPSISGYRRVATDVFIGRPPAKSRGPEYPTTARSVVSGRSTRAGKLRRMRCSLNSNF